MCTSEVEEAHGDGVLNFIYVHVLLLWKILFKIYRRYIVDMCLISNLVNDACFIFHVLATHSLFLVLCLISHVGTLCLRGGRVAIRTWSLREPCVIVIDCTITYELITDAKCSIIYNYLLLLFDYITYLYQ